MELTVHRGTHTIGGSCVEIRSGNSRILLDLGLPLMERDGIALSKEAMENPSVENGVLPDVAGLYSSASPSVDAVILSHAHPDHYGLMDRVHVDIPVYLSRESRALIEVGNIFYMPELRQEAVLTHCRTFAHGEPFQVGPFIITSCLADHSAFGASSLVIEAEGQRIFYTGDLRGHGRKGRLFRHLVTHPIERIDCLLMEGTTLGGNHESEYRDEEMVEQEMYRLFRRQGDASFVIASGSNIDRLVSIYRAAMKAGKTLVIDLYQAHMLDRLKTFSPRLPFHEGDGGRVFFIDRHGEAMTRSLGADALHRYLPREISLEEILKNRNHMVLRLPLSVMIRIGNIMNQHRSLSETLFIYSMWQGYRRSDNSFDGFCERYQVPNRVIHTSGHAYVQDLKLLARALRPKMLVPIHTLAGDDFGEHFENVCRLDDGESLEVAA